MPTTKRMAELETALAGLVAAADKLLAKLEDDVTYLDIELRNALERARQVMKEEA